MVKKENNIELSDSLDIGCGRNCLAGAAGIDQFSYPGVQFVHDLNQTPWPFPENHFRHFRCWHAIEHFRELHLIVQEIYRIAAPGSQIELATPHYSSVASWGDPTHLWHFSLASLPLLFEQALKPDSFKVLENKLMFTGSAMEFPGWLTYKISSKKYEKHLAWMFPANEIRTRIELIK